MFVPPIIDAVKLVCFSISGLELARKTQSENWDFALNYLEI
jgi:hypothetical protein